MKTGDLVRPRVAKKQVPAWALSAVDVHRVEEDWVGIIIGWHRRHSGDGCDPIVMWNENFPDEIEYKEQLEVISGPD